ncbi:hypothetical protein L218DRAFT_946775 [Marasmius fiardii PR-910]|nr:hypothetical protein L218DRAFT_946775 [Marasmius fiardii PR-910]
MPESPIPQLSYPESEDKRMFELWVVNAFIVTANRSIFYSFHYDVRSIIDLILIFRCFVIFGYGKKRRLYPVLVVAFCILIDRFPEPTLKQYVANAFLGLSALINFTLTSVLAGRIWWLTRGMPLGRFRAVVTILLESGVLYIIGLAIFMADNLAEGTPYDAGSVLIQIGGITPTLIIVRANPDSSNTESKSVAEGQDNSNLRGGGVMSV